MKKYEAYKDSGIAWIGMIPEGWETLKMKSVFSVIAGATPDSSETTFWDGDIVWVTPADFKSKDHYISEGKRFISQKGYESCATTIVPAGSIVVSKRAPIGSVVIARKDLCTNQGCLSFVPTPKANSNFYYYALSVFTEALEMYGTGTTFKEISAFDFSNFRIPYPTLAEQQAIADYLDYKVGQIDTSVADINTQIEDLKAYRQAVISEAVTKGLNPDAPMKDSGIEWIGMIPEGWECTKLAWLYSNMGSGTTPDSSNYSYYSENGTNWLQTGDLNDGVITSTSKHVTDLALQEKGLKIYPVGSVVIAMYGATIGKVGLLSIETTTNQACCVLPPTEIMNNKYVFYLMQSSKQILISKSVGGGQPNISQAIIKEHRVPTPPLAEQQTIADYLDEKTSKIDTAIKSLENQRDDLNALRQTVISEAVTGKVDLRDWKK